MNFYFGHTHNFSAELGLQYQNKWLSKTIFARDQDSISTHSEDGFSLTLVNDPNKLCPYQSQTIFVTDDFVCATDCHLFNKVHLSTKLKIDPNSRNEEFFIAAFLTWGEEFADKFDGKFSFIIWDRNNKQLLAGPDHLGYGIFSYSQAGQNIYFSSDLAILLDQPNVDKSINMKRFYQCLRYSNNSPEQTYFQYCCYCPPGHILKVKNAQIETTDYWKLIDRKPSKTRSSEADYNNEFIRILRRSLDKEITTNQKLGLMLSGGYDSSLLAAILAENQTLKNNLNCYSYVFEKFTNCDESEYIMQTTDQLNLRRKLINCDDKTVLSDFENRRIIKEIINTDSYASLPETVFLEMYKDQQEVLISGLNGDDLFTGSRYMYADLLKQKRIHTIKQKLFSADSVLQELGKLIQYGLRPNTPKSIKTLYRTFVKTKEADNLFQISDDQINNVENEAVLKQCKLFHHQNLLKLVYYRNIPESLYYLRKDLYLNFRLQAVLPYYNKQMIEYIWNLPVNYLEKEGRVRGIQIACLKLSGLEHIVNRKSKTSFHHLIEQGIKDNQEKIKQTAECSTLIENSLLEKDIINSLCNKIGVSEQAWSLRFFMLLELWFRSFSANTKEK